MKTVFAIAWLAGSVAHAQGPTISPPVLRVPGSTRALALGNAYTALGADPDAIFYNPAQLVPARGVGISVQRFARASTALTLSSATVLAPGTVAVGVQLLDQAAVNSYFDLAVGGERNMYVRGDWLATGAVASLAYARPAFFDTRVGVTGKVIHQEYAGERDVTGAFDVGVSRGSSFQLAIVGRNLGPGVRLDDVTIALPRELAIGAAMPRREVGPLDLAATASIAMITGGYFVGGGGTELSYMPLDGFTFAARLGYRAVEGAESHFTVGGGFVGERVSLDYAWQAPDGTGASHRVGVRWR